MGEIRFKYVIAREGFEHVPEYYSEERGNWFTAKQDATGYTDERLAVRIKMNLQTRDYGHRYWVEARYESEARDA